MEKKIIKTNDAPAPIGPYNQAVIAGNTVYISGQIAIDPVTGNLKNTEIETETHQVLQNLASILKAADSNLGKVIKTSIFLSDMDLFSEVNKVYAQYFDEANAPARECVAVKSLPKNVNVEISAIAIL